MGGGGENTIHPPFPLLLHDHLAKMEEIQCLSEKYEQHTCS